MKRAIAALSAAFLFTASTGWAGAPKVRRPDLFLKVWRPFRAAILSGNPDAIKPLTRFPVRWETETGEEKKTAKDIAAWFPTLLKAPSGVKPRQSVKQYVAEKEDLAGAELDALRTGEVRLGPLTFRRFGDKWLFAAARVDGSTPVAPVATAPREKELDLSEIERAPAAEPAAPVVEIIDEPIPSGVPAQEEPPAPKPTPPTPKVPAPKPAMAPKPPPPVSAAVPASNEGFRGFWRLFRDAVLSNDLAMVQSMTKFSFETRGPEESSRVKKHSARDFVLLYPRLLQTDPKTGPLRDNMRELIWRKPDLTVNEIGTADSLGEIHIGVFVFKRSKNRWAFVRATVED